MVWRLRLQENVSIRDQGVDGDTRDAFQQDKVDEGGRRTRDVDGNHFTAMSDNVILANAEDVILTNNVIGPLADAGSGAASESVIRSRGNGGTVRGNYVTCNDTVQRGILLDQNPVLR